MWSRLRADGPVRRRALAVLVYVLTTGVFFACAARNRLTGHTPWNHFALLAEAWLHGHLDLGGPPPSYAGNNDFAFFGERWFVAFPAFPAVLILPVVKLAGSAERTLDGQFFVWLSGLGPALLFLALERLRRLQLSPRTVAQNLALTLLFAFGTVYFFTAEQGTVWFAAHVVGVALAALYLFAAIGAEAPLLAGLALGLGFHTRASLIFAMPLFLCEAWRVCRRPEGEGRTSVHWPKLMGKLALFAVPLLLALLVYGWHNHLRFGSWREVGYRYLKVSWQARMMKYGLFNYHYLPRNLGVLVANLPWVREPGASAPFQINLHGLPLWFTTPLYFWVIWPARRAAPTLALWLTVLAVALPSLLYQNTGWLQFGQRFSNDYAPFLFALLAVGARPLGAWFRVAAVWAIAVNAFGALTFDRAPFTRFYFQDSTQKIVFPQD